MNRCLIKSIAIVLLLYPTFLHAATLKNCLNSKGQILVKSKCSVKKGERLLQLSDLAASISGPQGPKGEQGPQGIQGNKGDTGSEFIAPEVVAFRGVWSPGTTYNKYDLVSSSTPDLYFYSEVNNNAGQTPESNPGAWTGAELSQLKLIKKTVKLTSSLFSIPLFTFGSQDIGTASSAYLQYTLKAATSAALASESGAARLLFVYYPAGGIGTSSIISPDRVATAVFNTNFTVPSGPDGVPFVRINGDISISGLTSIDVTFRPLNLSPDTQNKIRLIP